MDRIGYARYVLRCSGGARVGDVFCVVVGVSGVGVGAVLVFRGGTRRGL